MPMRCLLLLCALLLPTGLRAAEPARLTILSYHEIAEAGQAMVPFYAVTPTNFVRQLDWLRNQGYRFVSVDDVLADREGRRPLPDKAVLVTFDDGYRSVYTEAWPILKMFRVPAVINVVGSWMEAEESIDFDGRTIPRAAILDWAELREMQASGLVEIGSHSHDLHHGIPGNPQGNRQPAATTRRFDAATGRYESEADYAARLRADLKRSRDLIRRQTGRAPRVITWPYGRYNATTRAIAEALGLQVGLTLDDGANGHDTPLHGLRRLMMEGRMGLWELNRDITLRNRDLSDNDRPQKVMHVDLDYLYDADPAQQERNLSHLLERIAAMGVNTVYLQAYADPDGNGAADAVYFPNRHLPVRADLFNRVAWQIRTRTPVRRLYAWMPLLAWQLPAAHPAAQDLVQTLPGESGAHLNMGYHRLSPFAPRVQQTLRELYADLARAAPFDGLLFHDDATLSDFEDASPFALAQYRAWALPGSVPEIRASDDLLGRWTILKINALDDLALALAEVVREQQPALKTARNLYARVVQSPKAEVWYSQSLDNSLARYDFTAIMAMPYMERAADAPAFFRELVQAVNDRPGAMRKVVFELQAVDWREQNRPVPSTELAGTIRRLYAEGVQHVGFYPEVLHRDHPDPAVLRPALDSKPNLPELP
jgi:biofilm PGA synthesis lipoprotein PgaB